jgi:hypothetical protein
MVVSGVRPDSDVRFWRFQRDVMARNDFFNGLVIRAYQERMYKIPVTWPEMPGLRSCFSLP